MNKTPGLFESRPKAPRPIIINGNVSPLFGISLAVIMATIVAVTILVM